MDRMDLVLTILLYFIGIPLGVILWKVAFGEIKTTGKITAEIGKVEVEIVESNKKRK